MMELPSDSGDPVRLTGGTPLFRRVCAAVGVGLLIVLAAPGKAPATVRAPSAVGGKLVFVTFFPFHPAASQIQVAIPGRRPTTIFSSDREIDNPRWSPNGRKIAFVMTAANGMQSSLFIIRANGKGLRRITTGRHFDESPTWSPDGKEIAFASDRSGNWDIWSKNLATGAVTRLTSNAATDWEPAWSPDGKSIAFASDRSGHFNIWVKDIATRRLRQFTFGGANSQYPAWSPNRRRLAFARMRTGIWNIWLTSPGARHAIQFTKTDTTALFPTWSPDGKWIAFESNPHLALFNIFIKALRGGSLRRITNNAPTGRDSIEPDWRP